jgi:hypothetical protein
MPKIVNGQKILTIGDTTRDGLLQITDTRWDNNGTLFVTVREMIGGGDSGWIGGMPTERMRRLARRALMYPDKTRSSRVVNRVSPRHDSGYITFAVSRIKP